MKIICATDFSKSSESATRVAASLSRGFGDTIVLVHVWQSHRFPYSELVTDPLTLQRAANERLGAKLRETAEALRRDAASSLSSPQLSPLSIEEKLLEGDPAEVLAALAEEIDARLIVVGTESRKGLSRAALGNVAERTVMLSHRPVLVAREGGALVEWALDRRPLRVAVGLDRSAASAAALAWIGELRGLFRCDVTFIHAYWPVEQHARLGVAGTGDPFLADPQVVAIIERELRPLVVGLPGEGSASLRVIPSWASPVEVILEEASAAGADLLVLGTHQKRALRRLWLGSTVQPILRLAEMPVLCVPATRAPAELPGPLPEVRHLLVATDFSELANRAVPFAYGLLAGRGGTVTICHVHEHYAPGPAYTYTEPGARNLPPKERADLEARLRSLAPAGPPQVATNLSVVEGGHAATALCQEANRLGADAICLTSHGRSGLGKTLLGSVAEGVLRHAEVPVFVVPRKGRGRLG